MAKTAAEKQADYRERLRQQGKRLKLIIIDQASWDAGFKAGKARSSKYPSPSKYDELSWLSGYIEACRTGQT